MKCNRCGAEYEGKFCSQCGAKAGASDGAFDRLRQAASKLLRPGEKKPVYLRWWFILLAVIVVFSVGSCVGCPGEKIAWEDIVLGELLPEPPRSRGEINFNSAEECYVSIEKISSKDYSGYVNACREMGFEEDAQSSSMSYTAFNADGYKLTLSYYSSSEELSIRLDSPMEMAVFVWPESDAGRRLPVPASDMGKFSHEREDGFLIYVGSTTKDDYAEYVSACIERGFDEDYSREENSYRACDDEGWSLTLRYEGGKVMSISIDAPEEEEPENVAEQDEKPESDAQPEKEDEPAKETEKTDEPAKEPEKDSGGLDPDFKKAMDSYEEFMDEYVDFMKRYNKSGGTDLGLMLEYTEYLTDYSEFCESFAEWDEGEMNDAELAYYLDVQTRVNKKLLEVTG